MESQQAADMPSEALKRFGRDLCEEARAGRLDPVIGRDDEIRRVIRVLSRKTKSNPVLIGEPGVGKTAIVEGLAHRIIRGEVPDTLRERTVVALDMMCEEFIHQCLLYNFVPSTMNRVGVTTAQSWAPKELIRLRWYLREASMAPVPLRGDILAEPLVVTNGTVAVPASPGLGIDLDLATVEAATTEAAVVAWATTTTPQERARQHPPLLGATKKTVKLAGTGVMVVI